MDLPFGGSEGSADSQGWETALALRGRGILGLAAPCAMMLGCFQPGRMPSATLPPDVEPATPRMVSRTPLLPAPESQAAIDGRFDPYGPTTLAIDPWKPSVPARHWSYIVLHHTASSHGSVESIHEAHLQRRDKNGNPWMGIGYHFVVGKRKRNGRRRDRTHLPLATATARRPCGRRRTQQARHRDCGRRQLRAGTAEPRANRLAAAFDPRAASSLRHRACQTSSDTATSRLLRVRESTSRWKKSPRGARTRCWERQRRAATACESPQRLRATACGSPQCPTDDLLRVAAEERNRP